MGFLKHVDTYIQQRHVVDRNVDFYIGNTEVTDFL